MTEALGMVLFVNTPSIPLRPRLPFELNEPGGAVLGTGSLLVRWPALYQIGDAALLIVETTTDDVWAANGWSRCDERVSENGNRLLFFRRMVTMADEADEADVLVAGTGLVWAAIWTGRLLDGQPAEFLVG